MTIKILCSPCFFFFLYIWQKNGKHMAKIGRYGSHMISPSELLNTGLRRASALRALQSAPPQGVAFRKSGEHPKIQGVKTAFSATNYYKWDFSQMILGYFRFTMVFNSSKTGFLNFNSSKAHSILLMGHSTDPADFVDVLLVSWN